MLYKAAYISCVYNIRMCTVSAKDLIIKRDVINLISTLCLCLPLIKVLGEENFQYLNLSFTCTTFST